MSVFRATPQKAIVIGKGRDFDRWHSYKLFGQRNACPSQSSLGRLSVSPNLFKFGNYKT